MSCRKLDPPRTSNSLDEGGTNVDRIGYLTFAVHSGEKWAEMNEVKTSNARLESKVYKIK